MKLRHKIRVIIGAICLCVITLLYATTHVITQVTVAGVEETLSRRNVEQVLSVFSESLSYLDIQAVDWATWDDTYVFIEDGNDKYIRSNLGDQTFIDLRLNLMMFVDSSGRIVFAKGFDRENKKEIPVPGGIMEHIAPEKPLLNHRDTDSSVTGLVLLPEGPMLVVSRPILTSGKKGPARGALIMGRYLDASEINLWAKTAHTPITIQNFYNAQILPDFHTALSTLQQGEPVFIQPLDADSVAGYALLNDIYGKPAVVLKAIMPREGYRQGLVSLFYTFLALLAAGLLLGILLSLVTEKVILSRLARLSDSIVQIGACGDLSRRVPVTGRDEIASLAGAINDMLAVLEQSHAREEHYRNQADELRAAYRQLQNIIESLPDPTFVVDKDRKVIAWNRAIEEMTGISKNDVTGGGDYTKAVTSCGKPGPLIFDIICSDRQDELRYEFMESRGDKLNAEVFVPFLQGKGAFLRVTTAPLFDWKGNLTGAIESVIDITRRKRMEYDLNLQKAYFQQLFDNSPDGIVMLDNADRIINANKGFERLFQYPVEEITGRHLNEVIVPDGFYEQASASSKAILEGKVVQEDVVRKRKDGSRVDVHVLGYPITVGEKQVGICAIYSDITERKRFIEQLQYLSLHDHLTGLYNRTHFEEQMHRYAGGEYNPVGIIVCDVDGLKLVNDTMGHAAGDALLVATAGLLGKCLRENDLVARIGGDEFAAILPRSDSAVVAGACRKIRDAVAVYNAGKPELPLSISIGYAVSGKDKVSITDLYKEADNLMYREKLHRSQSAKSAIVQTLMKALEARDFITEGHADRLQELVAGMAEAIGLPERSVTDLRLLAQFHDIGKVGISDKILFKAGPLTSDEKAEMQRHSEIGYRIAQSTPDLVPIAGWILKHHEWWNGAGYPLGLKGEEIPLECRILAIADAFDAMVSDRPYRKAMSWKDALNELKKNAGIQFDPQLVPKFMQVVEKMNLPGEAEAF